MIDYSYSGGPDFSLGFVAMDHHVTSSGTVLLAGFPANQTVHPSGVSKLVLASVGG
jgi:hypothetical protein